MSKRLLSIVLSIGLIAGVGVANATGASAAEKPELSTSVTTTSVGTPSIIGFSSGCFSAGQCGPVIPSTPSGPTTHQICHTVQVLAGFTGVWAYLGSVLSWVAIPIYTAALVCSILYY